MVTNSLWDLLNSKPEWRERCRSIAGIYPDPDRGAKALRDYVIGTVALHFEREGDWHEAERLYQSHFDYHSLYTRFRADHPFKNVLGE